MATYPLTDRAVLLKPEDDVAIAKKELTAGTVLEDGPTRITVRVDIKPGHKVARRAVSARQPLLRHTDYFRETVFYYITRELPKRMHQVHRGYRRAIVNELC